ncbi:MFS transporter [Fangia hongkongensis]|uniref:MFS transporter n=1 Tax=Fangia hongkongensis TaxID=270495 RepID=UPI00037ED835|nr:MFS transporter [Fangia hongkongensis]MBK2126266.1 MFS transporter [Fangia hongkongensis]
MKIKTAMLAGMGAGIEYYDFAIFALFAPMIGTSFFPNSHPIIATLYTFLIFALGYIIRPIGGLLFGFIGDRYGRKTGFFYTMLSLMISTVLMAVLPDSDSIGIAATVIFIILRLIQGLAIGGEIPTAIAFSTEHYPKKQGLAVSIVFAFLSVGILLSSFVYMMLSSFTKGSFVFDHAWRIAFLIGGILTLVIYILRKTLYETPEFLDYQKNMQSKGAVKEPKGRNIIASMLIVAAPAMLTTQFFLFLPSYLNSYFSYSNKLIGDMLFSGSIIMILGCIIGGFMSDYVKKRMLYTTSILMIAILAIVFYQRANEGHLSIALFMTISFLFGILASTYTVIIANSFSTGFRCRGIGLSYNLSYSVFSAPIPALSIYLIDMFKMTTLPIIFILAGIAISLIGFVILKVDRIL